MGTEKWGYNPGIFKSVDVNKDGLLNSTELNNYFNKLYTDTNTQSIYQSASDYLANADINGDGLISKGEIALYKSGQDYLDENTFKTKVVAPDKIQLYDIDSGEVKWRNFHDEYNLYENNDIISREEIIEHDKELYRTAMSFRSAAFNASDVDKNGFLDASEMKTYLENLYGTCSDKQIDYTFNNVDANGDGLISDGEFAMFKVNNDTGITSDKLVNAGYAKSDADALVKKYAPNGQTSFSKDDIVAKDDQLQGKKSVIDNTKDGMSVGGIIALIACCVIFVGLIAWGIWWLSKDDKKKEQTTGYEPEKREIENDTDNNLQTINARGKTIIIK